MFDGARRSHATRRRRCDRPRPPRGPAAPAARMRTGTGTIGCRCRARVEEPAAVRGDLWHEDGAARQGPESCSPEGPSPLGPGIGAGALKEAAGSDALGRLLSWSSASRKTPFGPPASWGQSSWPMSSAGVQFPVVHVPASRVAAHLGIAGAVFEDHERCGSIDQRDRAEVRMGHGEEPVDLLRTSRPWALAGRTLPGSPSLVTSEIPALGPETASSKG